MRAAPHRFDGMSRIARANQRDQGPSPFIGGKLLKRIQSGQIKQIVIKDQAILTIRATRELKARLRLVGALIAGARVVGRLNYEGRRIKRPRIFVSRCKSRMKDGRLASWRLSKYRQWTAMMVSSSILAGRSKYLGER